MSFSDDVKLKAQSALKPYLGGDQPSQVQNPILLLNYLYQHAIIPRPEYYVMATPNHSQHAVSCKIGDLQMIGYSNTNRTAKINAAQQFLDLLVKPVNVSRVHSSLNGVTSLPYNTLNVHVPVPLNSSNSDNLNISKNRTPFLNVECRIENCISSEVNESTSLNHFVEPQMGQDEEVQVRPQCDVRPENVVMDTFETLDKVSINTFQMAPSLVTQQSNHDSGKLSKDTLQVNLSPVATQQLNYDDFFDPFYKPSTPKTRGKFSVNTFHIALSLPTLQSDKISKDELSVYPSPVVNEQPNCDDFFDPFFKQRPPNSNGALIMEMEKESTENHIQNQEDQSNHTDNKPNIMESKNVFALLQKKTQKHLKLIPRFQIENIESGFRCNVRIGSYYAYGEGKNKKEAKTKAAVSLLNQINEFN